MKFTCFQALQVLGHHAKRLARHLGRLITDLTAMISAPGVKPCVGLDGAISDENKEVNPLSRCLNRSYICIRADRQRVLKAILPHKALTDTFNALQQALQVLITTTKILRQAIIIYKKASKISEACGAESSIRSASVNNMAGIQLALISKLS